MQFKLKNVVSNVSDTTTDTDRTHTLTFVTTDPSPVGVTVFGQSSVMLTMTAAEAAQYTIGSVYSLALTPVE
ncbi:TPA: hypothetical protein ACKQCJ_000365 [Stenotrophomonas maltophilia]